MSTNSSSPFLASALIYSQRYRWSIFPLKPREKLPATTHGLLDATRNEDSIRRWWGENPEYNIGVRTGDGLVVIDGDRRHNGHITLRDLIRTHGQWPQTYKVLTKDGAHFYFRTTRELRSANEGLGPGVDVKADGGYVVAPPSVHPSGHVYQFDVTSSSHLAVLPPWVEEVKGQSPRRFEHRRVMGGVTEGERDDMLFRWACWARRFHCPEELAEAAIVHLARKCQPPFPEDDAIAKVASVYSTYPDGQAPWGGDEVGWKSLW